MVEKKIKVRDRSNEVEDVAEFVFLSATVAKDGGGTEAIKNRLRKDRNMLLSKPNKAMEQISNWKEGQG